LATRQRISRKNLQTDSSPDILERFWTSGSNPKSAVSIPSNIAEGDDLETDKQSIRHFYIAKGSTAELLTQLIIANEIGYLDAETNNSLVNDCKIISVMLTKLIKARSN
jgi:four helix bundle protein